MKSRRVLPLREAAVSINKVLRVAVNSTLELLCCDNRFFHIVWNVLIN